jgi:hypothetical protein
MFRYFVSGILLWFLAFFAAASAHADPYGSPFQVNTSTSSNLYFFDVATGANGDSAVLWQQGETVNGQSFMQRYDAAGRPLQSQEWYVGTGASHVAVSGNGNFAVLRTQSDGAGYGVYVTVYNRSGSVIVPQFRVNDTLAGNQRPAGIAMNANGLFAVVWTVWSGTGPDYAVYAKRFQANGAAASAELLVHSNSTSNDRIGAANVAIDSLGNFTVSWDYGDIYSTEWMEVWARRYSSAGAALGARFRVNTYTNGAQNSNRIAMNESGAFVIIWQTRTQGNASLWGVYGQRYSATGAALGGEFLISTPSTGVPEGQDVAMAPNGNFVVTWHSNNYSPAQILGRGYSSSGAALSDAFIVSAANNIFATSCNIGMDRDGNSLIGWLQHHYSNTQFNYVYARRYSPAGVAIQPLANGQLVSGLAGATGTWRYFKITVPPGQTTLDTSIFGGSGDADLYVRWGALPSLSAWDGRPYLNGNTESTRMLNYPAGDWYIGINGYNAYSGLNLQATSY